MLKHVLGTASIASVGASVYTGNTESYLTVAIMFAIGSIISQFVEH